MFPVPRPVPVLFLSRVPCPILSSLAEPFQNCSGNSLDIS